MEVNRLEQRSMVKSSGDDSSYFLRVKEARWVRAGLRLPQLDVGYRLRRPIRAEGRTSHQDPQGWGLFEPGNQAEDGSDQPTRKRYQQDVGV